MNTEEAFLAAALPEPVILLGQRLEPYSVGHELLLRRHRCPFLNTPGDGSRPTGDGIEDQLFLAVFICSQRYEEAVKGLQDPELPKRARKWRHKLGELSGPEVLERIRMFESYVQDGKLMPHVRLKEKGNPRAGRPNLGALITNLLVQVNFGSYAEVMNCPYGLGLWLYSCELERKGTLVIRPISEEEEMAEMRAAAAAKGLELVKWRSN